MDEVSKWSNEIAYAVDVARRAHSDSSKHANGRVRFHDGATPYWIHPLWAAATLLQEPGLTLATRKAGYQALLWHDVLEDTNAALPDGTSQEVVRLVEAMTFANFADELEQIWTRSKEVRLLKLYDKVSNLLDATWMSHDKWQRSATHAARLADDVEQNFGDLNIVRIARAMIAGRNSPPAH